MFNNNLLGGLIPLKLANRNTATVNGKSIKEVTEAIDAMLGEDYFEQTHDHYWYIPVEKMTQRLTEIVGTDRFTMVPIPVGFQEIRYTAVPNAKKMEEKAKREQRQLRDEELEPTECVSYMEKIIAALVIYSDEGEAAIVKYAYGSAPYIFDGTSGRITAPSNVPQSAFSDASKRVCKELGIGQKQLEEKNAKKKRSENNQGNGSYQHESSYRILITDQFSSVGNGFKAPAVIKETGEKIFLVIWQKGIAEIEKQISIQKFIKSYVGKEITVVGSLAQKTIKGVCENQLTMSSIM